MTKTELKALKKLLPRGYFKKTIERSGSSERSVANFFSGKTYNLDIHKAVAEIAEEYARDKNAVTERIKAIHEQG